MVNFRKLFGLTSAFHHVHEKATALEIHKFVEGLGGDTRLFFDSAGHIALGISHVAREFS